MVKKTPSFCVRTTVTGSVSTRRKKGLGHLTLSIPWLSSVSSGLGFTVWFDTRSVSLEARVHWKSGLHHLFYSYDNPYLHPTGVIVYPPATWTGTPGSTLKTLYSRLSMDSMHILNRTTSSQGPSTLSCTLLDLNYPESRLLFLSFVRSYSPYYPSSQLNWRS